VSDRVRWAALLRSPVIVATTDDVVSMPTWMIGGDRYAFVFTTRDAVERFMAATGREVQRCVQLPLGTLAVVMTPGVGLVVDPLSVTERQIPASMLAAIRNAVRPGAVGVDPVESAVPV
jgi:SseB protein N-terminal domain